MHSRMEKLGNFDEPEKYLARVRNNEQQAKTHDLNSLHALLQEMKANNENSLLFLVDKNKNLHLARTGKATHVQMANPQNNNALCISAGQLIFNDNLQLVGINNFSYRFSPHFSSIKWLLVILMGAQEKLNLKDNDEITLELKGLSIEHLPEPAQEDLIMHTKRSLFTNKSLFERSAIGELCVTVGEIKQYIDLFKTNKQASEAIDDNAVQVQQFNLSSAAGGFFDAQPTPSPFKDTVNRTLKF